MTYCRYDTRDVVKPDQRLDDVRFWEKEVDDKLSSLKKETDALSMFRDRLNAAIEAYEEPLRIAQLCLANRSLTTHGSLLTTSVQRSFFHPVPRRVLVLNFSRRLPLGLVERGFTNRMFFPVLKVV